MPRSFAPCPRFAPALRTGYATRMKLGLVGHLLVLVALVVNLWFGGDLIQAWLGWDVRQVFEFALILGYMWLVLGIKTPLPWQRHDGPERGGDRDRRP